MIRTATGPSPATGVTAKLLVLATSDLHMNLLGFDYYADLPNERIGLTRTASLIRAARNEAEESGATVLLVDNGDSLRGSPLDEIASEYTTHPLVRCFEHLNYDAIGLGNHDFDAGIESLTNNLRNAACPVLCSNMNGTDPATPLPFRKFALLDRDVLGSDGKHWPLRLGLFSVLPPQTLAWNAHLLSGRVVIEDMLDCAQKQIGQLEQAGADLIIALAHTGLGKSAALPNMENALVPLAALPGLDAIVGGHTHMLLPCEPPVPLPTPTVMPGTAGTHLGQIDLDLTFQKEWTVTGSEVSLRAVSGPDTVLEDSGLSAMLAPLHTAARTRMQEPVGRAEQPLHSYFSLFAPDRGLMLVAAAQAAAARPHLNGTEFAGLPMLSAAAPPKFGGIAGPRSFTDIPAGIVKLRHLSDLLVFPNLLSCVAVSGEELRNWLEMSASVFRRIPPGSQNAALMNPDRAGHNFDVVLGITYEIDLGVPPRYEVDGTLTHPDNYRIGKLCWKGREITPNQRFVLATNNYRVSGGGNFLAIATARSIPIPEAGIKSVLREYLSGTLPRDPLQDAQYPWRFSTLPGTRVSVRTGPGAAPFLSELEDRDARPVGLDEQGFLILSLPL